MINHNESSPIFLDIIIIIIRVMNRVVEDTYLILVKTHLVFSAFGQMFLLPDIFLFFSMISNLIGPPLQL